MPDLQTNPIDVEPNQASISANVGPSFGAVYEQEFSYVWNSLRRLGIASRHLQDVSHDVFVVVHQTLPAYDAARPLKPWLFGITFRVASDFRRKHSNRREELKEVEAPAVEPTIEHELITRDRQALVRRALESIELDRRAVFVLHEIDGVTIPEIARALDLPLNTAYSRLRVARDEFRAAVKRHTMREEI